MPPCHRMRRTAARGRRNYRGNQDPFGKSFAHFARMRSSSALLERAMTGKLFLRRNGMQASEITRELRPSVSVS